MNIMEHLLLFSVFFLYGAYGAGNNYKLEFKNNRDVIPRGGVAVIFIINFLVFVLPTIVYIKYFDLRWFWAIPINIIITFMLSQLCYSLYALVLGRKSDPRFSLRHAGYVRHRLPIYDAMIAGGLGLTIFLLGLF